MIRAGIRAVDAQFDISPQRGISTEAPMFTAARPSTPGADGDRLRRRG
jgi:hypothetical protein